MSFIDNLRGHRPEQPAQDRKEPTLKNLITRRQLLNQAQETLRQAALDESALAISHPHRNSQQNLTILANGLQQSETGPDHRQDFTGRGFTTPPLLQPSRGKS